MSEKRKRQSHVVDYHRHFHRPRKEEVNLALGAFPFYEDVAKTINRELLLLGTGGGERTSSESINQFDNASLFVNTNSVWQPLPPPMDEDAWLAKYVEDGQSVDQYSASLTMRSGRFKPLSAIDKPTIYLLPIVEASSSPFWPSSAPKLKELREIVSAFFDRKVIVLGFATLEAEKKQRSGKDTIRWDTGCGGQYAQTSARLKGRICQKSKRFQTDTKELLAELANVKDRGSFNGTRLDDAFAIIGVTVLDLFSAPAELFIAGSASMNQKAAVLSFGRYHPMMKSSEYTWHDCGYTEKISMNPYFSEKGRRPAVVDAVPSSAADNVAVSSELFRRSAKLIIHEIGHLYGLEHCVHHHCNMNGTAHLKEDFAAPSHWCGHCLRKLHFRLGFDVVKRYENILAVYKKMGMQREVEWIERRVETLV